MANRLTKLEKALYNSTMIDQDKKEKYLDMAETFLEDLKLNINKTSIDLSEMYPQYSSEDWMEWLTFPAVSKYVNGYRKERITREAEIAMTKGSVGAAKIKDIVTSKDSDINSRYVVFRLPDKEDDGNG